MGRFHVAWLCVVISLPHAAAQSTAVREALASMQRGDFQSAEQKLRAEVSSHPAEPAALSLLGVTLDNLEKIPEAAAFHRRALAQAPRSVDVLNNFAAHYWIAGDRQEARKLYLQVLALDPAHINANLQLARLALIDGLGPEALRYLDHLPAAHQESPQVLLLRLEALYRGGAGAEAEKLSARLLQMARSDLSLSFAAATALSNARQFDKAEMFCEEALKQYPANFNVLYDLGLMATYAGHYGRAREVLEAALRQQPKNVDVLFSLARADEALKLWEKATGLLAQAAKLDPRRTDVQELLAVTASELGAFDDAAAAWDRLLKLDPANEVALRERSYTAAQMGQLESGIAGLESFLVRHPGDAIAHYELGQAEKSRDAAKAFLHFDKALELDPAYVPARTARGSLYYQEGKPEAAVKDLEIAAARRPDDAACLDRLGQAYQALDRTPDALRVLGRAAELAPQDSKTLLHFARALADAGKLDESKAVMERFRQLGPEKKTALPPGFVEYLNLTEEQRHADYRARVEKALRDRPDDPAVRLSWLKLMIAAGHPDQIGDSARRLAALKPDAAVLAEAGSVLIDARQYTLACEILKQAVAAAPSPASELELATALFRSGSGEQALKVLERLPESARGGDYYLALAEMLGALGKHQDTRQALDRALASAPPRADFYLRSTAFLVETDRPTEALRFLDYGARLLPQNREILLLRAATLELVHRTDEAQGLLTDIRSRWPEWYPVWVAHGIVSNAHSRPEDARRAFETAAALGAPAPLLKLDLAGVLAGALFR